MKKTAIVIGLGGMGLRHIKALKSLNIKIIAVCDKKKDKLNSIKLEKIKKTTNYKKLLKIDSDIVCISSNTKSRTKIFEDFFLKSKINKILVEKPLGSSFKKCLKFRLLVKRNLANKRVFVNTFRTLSPNIKKIKSIFKKRKEKITHISIHSPSAGLGNMGSIFFHLSNYFIEEKPISVNCWIDKTGTKNPRGREFLDPGGFGVVRYKKNKKVFFDLSENTALPYKIILKSQNLQLSFDEINSEFVLEERPKILRNRPNYWYLYQPKITKIKSLNKYDVVKLTRLSLKELFKTSRFKSNLEESIKSMEIVFGCHASKYLSKSVKIPLNKKFHKIDINFP